MKLLKQTSKYIGVIFLSSAVFMAGWVVRDRVCPTEPLPELSEIQMQLAAKGYYTGKIDGKYGDLTKTAWERAINDQHADDCFIRSRWSEYWGLK